MIRKALTDRVFLAATLGLALLMGLSAGAGLSIGRAGGLAMPWAGLWLPLLYLLALAGFAILRLRIAAEQAEERRAFERELDETRALYRLLAETATEVVLRTDAQGLIMYASPALSRHRGARPEELLGRHISEIVDPVYSGLVTRLHEGAIDGANAEPERWAEFVASGALGAHDGEHWFEIKIHSLQMDQGPIYGAVSLLRNIDERKAFEERLFEAG